MKFLCCCFGSCCASIRTTSKEEGRTLFASGCRPEESTKLLASSTRTRTTRRKRGRGGRQAPFDWKPSLGPISENNVFPRERMAPEMDLHVKRNKYLSGSGSSAAANKVHSFGSSYHDDCGPGSTTSFLPVVAATPFMF